jgi:hypothetical protein
MLPDGTTRTADGWESVCDWPPDLFAAMATTAERSGLYSERGLLSKGWVEETTEIGRDWARLGTPPRSIQSQWSKLVGRHGEARIDDRRTNIALPWKRLVFRLLVIADEACVGIGFLPRPRRTKRSPSSKQKDEGGTGKIQHIVYRDYIVWLMKDDPDAVGGHVLPYLPLSLCILVPPAIACVQPKTRTPGVGCTMRSLTHHLALLPPVGSVLTRWLIAHKPDDDLDAFNVLVVPFPFSIPGKSFKSLRAASMSSQDFMFSLNPDVWMRGASPAQFANFLCELVATAEPELERVHAIILPETALRLKFADKVAEILAKKTRLTLFLTGVVSEWDGKRSQAAFYSFDGGEPVAWWNQSKHHRWCLDGEQIRRYQLGHVLDPHSKWWEDIEVSYRECYVMLFRQRAALCALICEDLARYEPVLTVMNAIGPNLVVALLMDGPQLEHRWPGRYATVLADDPGSAVLTVTSLGMVARSTMPGEPQHREIALWKEANGRARTLSLPQGHHALLLTLTSRLVEEFTLDGRGDGRQTVQFGLGAAHGIKHGKPPKWLGSVP